MREGTTAIQTVTQNTNPEVCSAGNSLRDSIINRNEGSDISKLPGMVINMLIQKLCREAEVGFVGKFRWED